jgi:hypothetical protein
MEEISLCLWILVGWFLGCSGFFIPFLCGASLLLPGKRRIVNIIRNLGRENIMQQLTLHPTYHPEIRLIKHDIRNRLSALKLNIYILERQGHVEQHDALLKMKAELGEINDLLENLDDSESEKP